MLNFLFVSKVEGHESRRQGSTAALKTFCHRLLNLTAALTVSMALHIPVTLKYWRVKEKNEIK